MSLSNFMYLFIFFAGLCLSYKFLAKFFHVMVLLMTLEMLMLLNLWNMIFSVSNNFLSLSFLLIFFTLSVSEACLGLSILVHLSRTYGEEMKKNF